MLKFVASFAFYNLLSKRGKICWGNEFPGHSDCRNCYSNDLEAVPRCSHPTEPIIPGICDASHAPVLRIIATYFHKILPDFEVVRWRWVHRTRKFGTSSRKPRKVKQNQEVRTCVSTWNVHALHSVKTYFPASSYIYNYVCAILIYPSKLWRRNLTTNKM